MKKNTRGEKNIMTPIYFSKIQFIEYVGHGIQGKSIILLDLDNRKLVYQVLGPEKKAMPAIKGTETITVGDHSYTFEEEYPAKVIRTGKNDFKRQLIREDKDYEVLFSEGIKITEEQMEKLLPYCNALDFEPYRDKKMSMSDEGYIGYRDEIDTYFTGITNSYIPKIDLLMDYFYDEEHIWPSEKLYRYLVKTFFEGNKKFRKYGPVYGAFSLFF